MNIDNLTLGEIKEITTMFNQQKSISNEISFMGWNIVILQRGWVVIGKLEKHGEYFLLKDGFIIRSWGTEKGLGQLALEGKKSNTKLDEIPETKFHELTVIAILKCKDEIWEKI